MSFTKSTIRVAKSFLFYSFSNAVSKFRIFFVGSTKLESRHTIPLPFFARLLRLNPSALLVGTLSSLIMKETKTNTTEAGEKVVGGRFEGGNRGAVFKVGIQDSGRNSRCKTG